MDRPVLHMMGLKGECRIDLDWSEEFGASGPMNGSPGLDPGVISVALKKVGLNLEPRKAAVKILVVDHVNKEPTHSSKSI